jgi:hypothetical protein
VVTEMPGAADEPTAAGRWQINASLYDIRLQHALNRLDRYPCHASETRECGQRHIELQATRKGRLRTENHAAYAAFPSAGDSALRVVTGLRVVERYNRDQPDLPRSRLRIDAACRMGLALIVMLS